MCCLALNRGMGNCPRTSCKAPEQVEGGSRLVVGLHQPHWVRHARCRSEVLPVDDITPARSICKCPSAAVGCLELFACHTIPSVRYITSLAQERSSGFAWWHHRPADQLQCQKRMHEQCSQSFAVLVAGGLLSRMLVTCL